MASFEPRAADFDCTVSQRRDPNLGTVIDGYRIDDKIAEGGFGAVYRAKHLASGSHVALKILHAHFSRDPNMTARFQREATTMSRLSNPHTVATRGVGENLDGTLYIAMELLHGECLHERLRRGPMPWRHVVTMARAICASLTEAHALGVVHRDLKPANIHLAEQTDFVKVLDFGIVEVRGSRVDDGEDLTRAGMTVGTLDYMSPEQITERPCDGRSDLYSLGVLLYESLTGRRPFAGLGGPQLLAAMLTQLPERPSAKADVPPELDRIVLRCLRRDARERYADVRLLDAALAAVLAAFAPPAMPTMPAIVDDDEAATTMAVVPPPPMAHPSMLPMAATLVAMPALPRPARGSVAGMREAAAHAIWAAGQRQMQQDLPAGIVMPQPQQLQLIQQMRPSLTSLGHQRAHETATAVRVTRDRAVTRMAILAAVSVAAAAAAVIAHWM